MLRRVQPARATARLIVQREAESAIRALPKVITIGNESEFSLERDQVHTDILATLSDR
jgi:hypothetical protein